MVQLADNLGYKGVHVHNFIIIKLLDESLER